MASLGKELELDQLPEEILLEIFKKMDGETLKNSSLVQKICLYFQSNEYRQF